MFYWFPPSIWSSNVSITKSITNSAIFTTFNLSFRYYLSLLICCEVINYKDLWRRGPPPYAIRSKIFRVSRNYKLEPSSERVSVVSSNAKEILIVLPTLSRSDDVRTHKHSVECKVVAMRKGWGKFSSGEWFIENTVRSILNSQTFKRLLMLWAIATAWRMRIIGSMIEPRSLI